MTENLTTTCNTAAQLVRSFPPSTTIRVGSHYDADGISAAGILCTALHRAGYDFHATLMRNPYTKGFERLQKETNELIIFSDMGSGQMETLEQFTCPIIILDHHQYTTKATKKNIIQINSNLSGSDGNYESCGATLSYLFAVALHPANEDLAALALAGATGDKQHIGGFRGLNKTILETALQKGHIKEHTGIKLYGETITDALNYAIDPYYPGLSGNTPVIQSLLQKLTINPSSPLHNITPEQMNHLQSYLLFTLIKAGCQPNILDTTIRKRYTSPTHGWELERFADLLDACGKNGHRSLGLAICLGNSQVWNDALAVEKDYKQKILDGLQPLEHEGIHETEGMRYFYAQNSSLGGVIAGIAANYIFDDKKPLFSLTRKETDHELHISCRGNQTLVEHGLDLGGAMKTVTAQLSGSGGGHKIAAGATIAFDKEQEFIEKTDQLLVQQLRKQS
jgi:RecJ-like exonuclease